MRNLRAIVPALLSALLGLGLASAGAAPASAGTLPKRIITEAPPGEHQIDFNTFVLKGKVQNPVVTVDPITGQAVTTYTPYAKSKVQLQKKSCRKGCPWRTVRKLRTNDKGKYRTRIDAPRNGRWKYRVKVKHSDGYATTKGEVWTLFFK